MKGLYFSLLAMGICVPSVSPAQDTYLDPIVITANRTATDLRRIGVSVAVVEDEDLKKARDTSVADYLAKLPGISLAQQGPFGNSANLRIRGADGRYLAVFVDGIKVSDPSSTEVRFDFGSLLTSDISRIEVLRGSQSALWGGSAVGGVINISTRATLDEGLNQTVTAEAGSFGTAKLAYGLTLKDEKLDLSFGLTHLRTDGFSAFGGGTEADGARATRLSFSSRYQVSDTLALGGSFFVQDTWQEYDGYVAFVLADVANEQSRREAGVRSFAELSTGSTEHLFEASLFDMKRSYVQPGDLSSFGGRRLSLGYQGTTEVSDALTLVYGLDWNDETATYTNLPGGKADTRIWGAFAQAIWAPSDSFDVSATVRTDRNSGFGTFDTGRLALAWRPSEGTTIRAAAATGFRAPSIDERFGDYPGSFPFVGNPNLTPEDSLSYELGIEHAYASGAVVSATAFRLAVDNLITYQFGTPSTLANVPGRSVRQGVELAASTPIGEKLNLGLAYTYTDGRRADGKRLVQVPRHDLTLTMDAELSDKLSGGLQLKHVAGRLDNDPSTFAPEVMPDYTVLNAQLTYQVTDSAEAYLRIENLTDTRYEKVNGYEASRRAIYAGIQAKF